MPTLTPEEIQAREFLVSLRGYDRDEVHNFLEEVAKCVHDLQSQLEVLQAGQTLPQPPEDGRASEPERSPNAEADPKPFLEDLGQMTQRIVEAAYESAAEIQRRARSRVEREFAQARSQAAKLVAEGQRRREVIEGLVEMLEERRAALAEDLKGIAKMVEEMLADFAPREELSDPDELLAAAEATALDGHWEAGEHAEGEDAWAVGEAEPATVPQPAAAEPVAEPAEPAEVTGEDTGSPNGGGSADAPREAPAAQASLDVRLI